MSMDFEQMRLFPTVVRQRAQGTVEYGLVVAGGALLALLSYTLFSPIVTAAADQVKALLPSFH
jgi:hypothetical protein